MTVDEKKNIEFNLPGIDMISLTDEWHDIEELYGYCRDCNGEGVKAVTFRASVSPLRYPEEYIMCPECGGSGIRNR